MNAPPEDLTLRFHPLMNDQSRSAHSDRSPSVSFELEESVEQTGRRRYEGPCQHAVYSPLPVLEPGPLVGESRAFEHVQDLVGAAAESDLNLLIHGESGTGKNLAARVVHARSERSDNWFIVVNCERVCTDDLEPLLLGPSKTATEGVFEAAMGGTVVLDHVDELGPDAQACLNHILETHSFERLGGSGSGVFDVRLVSTTTQELPEETFRKNLYFKLNQFHIRIPPLRSRSDDAVHLARHFLGKHPEEAEDEGFVLSDDAVEALRHHSWPGNVRELENAVSRAVDRTDTSEIEADDFLLSSPGVPSEDTTSPSQPEEQEDDSDEEAELFFLESGESIPQIEEIKREAVQRAYEVCDGDVDQAAVELGIGRSTMYRMLKRYDIK